MVFSVAVFVLAGTVVYASWTVRRALGVYEYLRAPQRYWDTYLWRADPVRGWAAHEGVETQLIYAQGGSVPATYDAQGYRVPPGPPRQDGPGPVVLSLGDSWTFGTGCRAAETFTYRTAEGVGGVPRNAAVGAYGLAQMLLQGERLLPEVRPDVLLVQYGPWLVDRAMRPYGNTWLGVLPCPYFADDDTGGVYVAPPAFMPIVFRLPIRSYISTAKGRGAFLWDVGLPLMLHDTGGATIFALRRALGLAPAPTANRAAIIAHTYEALQQSCRALGTRMVIVSMAMGDDTPVPAEDRAALEAFEVVYTQDRLWPTGADPDRPSWYELYGHWRGETLVDNHPNAAAHALMAEEIIKTLRTPTALPTEVHGQ